MRVLKLLFTFCMIGTFSSNTVYAGFLDKLNAATQKINNASQQIKNLPANSAAPKDEDPNRPLHLEDHYKGSCEGKRSATCMDYMEIAGQCMEPLKGYRAKVAADRIAWKLKNEKFNDQLQKNLEEDLNALREAEKNKTDEPTIAGQKSQRYLQDISEEDQVWINAEYGKFYQKIYNKCMGADHMGIGKRTEMNSGGGTLSGDEAIAALKAKRAKEEEPFNCLKGVSSIRYTVMAEMMEKKMQNMKLSDKDQAEWEADIISLKEAGETGLAMPKAVDPANPYRGMMRLTATEDQMAMSQETQIRSQQLIDNCNKKTSGKIEEREIKSGGLVDRSKSPANKKAVKQENKRPDAKAPGGGGSLSASLGATNLTYMKGYVGCFEPLKGHFAKVHADFLETKLKAAGNIPDQKRKEWEEDIAAWREAEKNGADQPNPPDPDNPYRWYDYVTSKERSLINKQHADFNNKIMKECGDKPSGL